MKYDIKQYIVINNKADWSKGKIASQVAHASMAIFMRKDHEGVHWHFTDNKDALHISITPEMHEWLRGSFAKVILKADGIDELKRLKAVCLDFHVPFSWIKDSGATQDVGEEGVTLGIGPINVEDEKLKPLIDRLSELKLY